MPSPCLAQMSMLTSMNDASYICWSVNHKMHLTISCHQKQISANVWIWQNNPFTSVRLIRLSLWSSVYFCFGNMQILMVHLLFGNRADISQFNCQPLNISLIKSLWSNELLWVSKMYHVRNHMWQWVKKQRKRKRSQVISLSGSAGPLLSFFPLAVLDGAARSWKEL